MPKKNVPGFRLKLTKNNHASKLQKNKRDFFNSKKNRNWKGFVNWKPCETDLLKKRKKLDRRS